MAQFHRTKIDDDFYPHLTKGARLVGEPGIPALLQLDNVSIPRDLIPFDKARTTTSSAQRRAYVHFYMHDRRFSKIITDTDKYIPLLQQFDGVITPDPTILDGQAPCLQQTNTYFNRAVGFYLQRHGIPVIPNVRWGDKATYSFCFLGVPEGGIVSVGTHGCMKSNRDQESFYNGLAEMIRRLAPTDVLVHGKMPKKVFGDFEGATCFHRYASWFERTHAGRDESDGAWV